LFFLKKDLDDVIGGEVTDARAVVKLNWNFSTGGAQYAKIRQRQAGKFEMEARKRELERQLAQALEQAWIEYETAGRMADNMQRRREINQELFETNKTQFDGAQIRLLQLMQSENQYFQTRLEYINARYREQLSELSVLAALGELQKTMEVDVPDVEYIYKSPFRFDDD
jgi:adhesin transport system outer membrane protein